MLINTTLVETFKNRTMEKNTNSESNKLTLETRKIVTFNAWAIDNLPEAKVNINGDLLILIGGMWVYWELLPEPMQRGVIEDFEASRLDAKLIAAAPDMLEALQDLLFFYRLTHKTEPHPYNAFGIAKKAIQKATS